MRKNLTEIVFIIDRSGSMSGLEQDTIGGFNSMILFDNVSEVLHDRINVKDIQAPVRSRLHGSGMYGIIRCYWRSDTSYWKYS